MGLLRYLSRLQVWELNRSLNSNIALSSAVTNKLIWMFMFCQFLEFCLDAWIHEAFARSWEHDSISMESWWDIEEILKRVQSLSINIFVKFWWWNLGTICKTIGYWGRRVVITREKGIEVWRLPVIDVRKKLCDEILIDFLNWLFFLWKKARERFL